MNYSLNRLQSIFQNALNKELKNATPFIRDINMNTLLLHEANMLLVVNNLQQKDDSINVAFYLTELESEIAQQISEGKSEDWFVSLNQLICHYKTRWIDGIEENVVGINNNDI